MTSSNKELQKTVVSLFVVERPLNSSSGQTGAKMGVPHQGCVAVTKDGQHYLIEKGVAPDGLRELHRIGGDQGTRAVNIGDRIPANYTKIKQVEVTKHCTLNDLVEASGKDYNFILRNCWNSTEEMQKVVNNELHLPWQLNAGVGVEILAVFAMALVAIGRLLIGAQRH